MVTLPQSSCLGKLISKKAILHLEESIEMYDMINQNKDLPIFMKVLTIIFAYFYKYSYLL